VIDLPGLQLRWFDRWLKGENNGMEQEPPVMRFVMGIDHWHTEADWPLPDTQYRLYYLHSAGQANTLHSNGTLSAAPVGSKNAVYGFEWQNYAIPWLAKESLLRLSFLLSEPVSNPRYHRSSEAINFVSWAAFYAINTGDSPSWV
jgi:putative CocE/NonD family hydrolase